jgi:hypothetical protein
MTNKRTGCCQKQNQRMFSLHKKLVFDGSSVGLVKKNDASAENCHIQVIIFKQPQKFYFPD